MILPCNRREFLKFGATFMVSAMVPLPALAAVSQKAGGRRELSFFNTHTHESLDVCYFEQGGYRPEALERVNTILRDHRTGEIQPIDCRLLDILHALKTRIRPRTPFHIISGFRSPTTNAMLRRKTGGVARTSYHIKGKAIDIRLPGYRAQRLRKQCIALRSGGVGYYPKSDFVHIDTGPVRTW